MPSPIGRRGARQWVAAVALMVLSALLQFTHINETDHAVSFIGDSYKYVAYAYNLEHHATFSHIPSYGTHAGSAIAPDKMTLPGFPAFLTLFLGDGNPGIPFAHRVHQAQAVLGTLSTLLAFLIALRLMPFGWAFAAGLLAATAPHLIVMSGYLITETLSTTLLLAFVLAALHAIASGKQVPTLLAGLFLGLSCLVRPQLQALPWLLLLAVIFIPRLRPRMKQAALACTMFAVVVLPWQLRNTLVTSPDGDPDLLVATLYHGSFPNFMYEDIPASRGYPYAYDKQRAEHARDFSATVQYIGGLFAERPARYLHWYFIGKPGAFLSWHMVEGIGDIFLYPIGRTPWVERPTFRTIRAVHFALHWPLMLLAVTTAALALLRPAWLTEDPRRRLAIVTVATLLVYVIALHLLGMPLPRYNIPYQPLEFALALVGLRALVRRYGPRRKGATA